MKFPPPRRNGLLLGAAAIALLAASDGLYIALLRRGPVSFLSLVWGLLLIASTALIGFIGWRTYAAARAVYKVEDGALTVAWGWQSWTLPLAAVRRVVAPSELDTLPGPRGVWWPGCVVGTAESPELGSIRYFSASAQEGLIFVVADEVTWALSPADAAGFRQALEQEAQRGGVETVEPVVRRPALLDWGLWRDRWAQGLVGASLGLLLLLFGYLAARLPALPAEVPLHFNAQGQPDRIGPPAGLLILPLIGLLSLLINVPLGGALHLRGDDRAGAYLLWAGALAIQLLLWAAALGLLAQA